jgi:hypothetical protein
MWNIVIEESYCTSGTRRTVTFLVTYETVARLSFSRGVQLLSRMAKYCYVGTKSARRDQIALS